MSGFDKTLRRIEEALTWVPLALAAIIGAAQILIRFVFGSHLLWGEEAIIYLIVLSTYVGASLLVRDNGHIAMQVISPFLKRRGKWVMDIIGTTIALVFFALMTYLSVLLVTDPSALNTVTRVLKMPLWMIDSGVLLGFLLMGYHTVRNLVTLLRTRAPLETISETAEALMGIEGQGKGGAVAP
ncbi:TRAP transporter small permease [Salinibacterium sp. dk2585]|uniref:TRAP transporter small permease n=1 Tax=unclassified Salinibacterium TaxID=2632331 RepID=UPI0011C25317|nr:MULTISPECIES: TRAP transporter small permease [unclassified Salinibacterium]QEE62317.1 TRAP transporter small permease [Salinibacterium sp. dk2585]TXK53668.1 TRAP transporter small permease [Salinibacterium sp. dk5596]